MASDPAQPPDVSDAPSDASSGVSSGAPADAPADPSADDRSPAAAVRRSLELLWDGLRPAAKGPKPSLRLDELVAAAIALADAEGVEALSMRRIARELGVGTMSLYRYVPDKSVLLSLVVDHVSAPTRTLEEASQRSWRESLEADAWESRALYLRHPWLLQINMIRPALGPNAIAALEVTMSGLRELPLRHRELITLVSALDAYVTGSVRQQILYEKAAEESGLDDEEYWGIQVPFLERGMECGRFPILAGMDEDCFDAGWEETFAFGLERFLDGVAMDLANR